MSIFKKNTREKRASINYGLSTCHRDKKGNISASKRTSKFMTLLVSFACLFMLGGLIGVFAYFNHKVDEMYATPVHHKFTSDPVYYWTPTSDYKGVVTITRTCTHGKTDVQVINIDDEYLSKLTINNGELTSVSSDFTGDLYIPYGVTKIGNYSVKNNTNVTGVYLSPSVTEIGKQAFENCTNLSVARLNPNITMFEYKVFYDCNLDENTLIYNGAKIVKFKTRSLANNNFSSIVFPTDENGNVTLTHIYDHALENNNIESVTIPNSVIDIGVGAFNGNGENIYNVWEDGCYLGRNDNPYYFLVDFTSNVSRSTGAIINKDIVKVSSEIWNQYYSAEYVANSPSNSNYDSGFEVSQVFGNHTLHYYLYKSGDNAGLRLVGCQGNDGVYNYEITDVVIPNYVIDYSYGCLVGVSNYIEKLTIGVNAGRLGNLFHSSSDEYNSRVPATLEMVVVTSPRILAGEFQKCAHLKYVIVEENVSNIGNDAFWGCQSLEYVVIKGASTIGNTSFDECYGDNFKVFVSKDVVFTTMSNGNGPFMRCWTTSVSNNVNSNAQVGVHFYTDANTNVWNVNWRDTGYHSRGDSYVVNIPYDHIHYNTSLENFMQLVNAE